MNSADQWRRWLRQFARQPEDRFALALAAVDAFEALSAGMSTDDQPLAALVTAASSPYKLVFETGCHLLVELAESRPDCQQAIDRMASSRSATARFHAVAYLTAALPESLRLSVIDRALSDRSARVRAKAVEQVETFGFRHWLPRLEAMMASETRGDVRGSLALHIPLLRDGFWLQSLPDGTGYWLTVHAPHGIGGPFIPRDRYSETYVNELVERLKKGHWYGD
jgi:hypothetical protein